MYASTERVYTIRRLSRNLLLSFVKTSHLILLTILLGLIIYNEKILPIYLKG